MQGGEKEDQESSEDGGDDEGEADGAAGGLPGFGDQGMDDKQDGGGDA